MEITAKFHILVIRKVSDPSNIRFNSNCSYCNSKQIFFFACNANVLHVSNAEKKKKKQRETSGRFIAKFVTREGGV